MRIAQVTATFPPYRGGTGNVCYHNARILAERGHEVHVFTAALPDAPSEEWREGIRIHRLRPLLRVGNAPVLPSLLGSLRGFEVIHLHYPFFGGEITTFAARRTGVPLVITYHQDVHLGGLLGIVEAVLRRSVGRLTLRAAARVLFTSTDYAQASRIRPLLRGREARIGELSNGVDVDTFTPGPAPAWLQARYAITQSDQVVLLVAGLDRAHYFKGVDILLAALAMLPARIKGLVVGDGDLRPAYAARAAKLGIAERVTFAGRVSETELADHYRLADVTVLPSVTMGEAFGLVLLESLATAIPVIASDLPGVRTVVAPGIDGFLVERGSPAALADALRRLLADAETGLAMGQAGRAKVVEHYRWEVIGARLEDLYRQVLESEARC